MRLPPKRPERVLAQNRIHQQKRRNRCPKRKIPRAPKVPTPSIPRNLILFTGAAARWSPSASSGPTAIPRRMYATWLYTLVLTIVVVVLGWYFRAQAGDYWSWIAYALIGLWLIQAVRMLYYRFHDRYVLTNHKLLHKSGLVIQKTDRIEVIDIDNTT